jgi:hypothetical protein
MIVIAEFRGTSFYKVPAGVQLLLPNENDKVRQHHSTPWSWYVFNNRLYWFDADCNVHKVRPYLNAEHDGINWKYPAKTMVDTGCNPEGVKDESESESEDESDDE